MGLTALVPADPLTRRAMLCAAMMMAHQVAGKAVRDSQFFSAFPASDYPRIAIAAALLSLGLGWVFSKLLGQFGPRRAVPAGYALSAVLQGAAWYFQTEFPRFIAAAIYLHIVSFGAVLLSGFWSVANEVFDPRTAKIRFGRIAGAGTAGGILGGLLAAGIPVRHALLLLVLFHGLAAAGLVLLRRETGVMRPPDGPAVKAAEVFRRAPYLRYLAGLVLLGTASAAIIDYLFKAGATEVIGKGAGLLRFFAIFYTSTQILTFVTQTFLTRRALEALGLSKTVATLPAAVGLGGMAALSIPVLPIFALVRGLEQILRGSLFRSGYELFYTPVPQAEKRSAKTLIDVGCDRLGDALGAGVVQAALLIAPAALARSEVLGATVVFAAAAAWIALRLDKAYSKILERGLLNRAIELDLEDVEDSTTLSAVLRTRHIAAPVPGSPSRRFTTSNVFEDPAVVALRALRSGDLNRVRSELDRMPPVDSLLAPQLVRLLAWDQVSDRVRQVLTAECEKFVGLLVDHLLDPDQEFAVRRRIPRILAASSSPRAADGLLEGLNDPRFEVRFHCGRALDAIHQREPKIAIPARRVYEIVSRELSVSRSIWESHRLLDPREASSQYAYLDEQLSERADKSLEHVFSLLSLVLPREPLKIAFRALHSGDRLLRGLAREYLTTVLPEEVDRKLWAIIDAGPPAERKLPPEEILSRLRTSHDSLLLKIPEGPQQK